MDNSHFQDANYLRDDQYRDSHNLEARAQLHQRFGTATMSWRLWVFNQLELKSGQVVLECGCGPGWLWRGNLDNMPPECQITMTDLSPGMVAEAEAALSGTAHKFNFRHGSESWTVRLTLLGRDRVKARGHQAPQGQLTERDYS